MALIKVDFSNVLNQILFLHTRALSLRTSSTHNLACNALYMLPKSTIIECVFSINILFRSEAIRVYTYVQQNVHMYFEFMWNNGKKIKYWNIMHCIKHICFSIHF